MVDLALNPQIDDLRILPGFQSLLKIERVTNNTRLDAPDFHHLEIA